MIRTVLSSLAGVLTLILLALMLWHSRCQRMIAHIRTELAPTEPATTTFSPAMVTDLPLPVQRYFLHALRSGIPLASSVSLDMTGTIRLSGQWYPFIAQEILTPARGFVWSTTVKLGAVVLQGADYYIHRKAGLHVALFDLVPVISVSGPDVATSALGRLVAETVWLPSSLLPQYGVHWEALDDNHIQATTTVDGEKATLVLTIDAQGCLTAATLQRWHSETRAYILFGMGVREERTFDGYTIPSQVAGGWWYGTERYQQEGEFIRLTIDEARFA